MSKSINFIQYRLDNVPYRRERWLRPPLGTLNTLHNRRLELDKKLVNLERGQTRRTYYKRNVPNFHFSRFCAHINTMIDRLRETGQAAVVLDFAHYKKIQEQRENIGSKKAVISRETN